MGIARICGNRVYYIFPCKTTVVNCGQDGHLSLKLDPTFLYSFRQQCGDKSLWKCLIQALRTIYWRWTQGLELLNETYDPHTPLCIIGYQINLIKNVPFQCKSYWKHYRHYSTTKRILHANLLSQTGYVLGNPIFFLYISRLHMSHFAYACKMEFPA